MIVILIRLKKVNFVKTKNKLLSKFKNHIITTKSNYMSRDLIFSALKSS